jgi:hypothetical protein
LIKRLKYNSKLTHLKNSKENNITPYIAVGHTAISKYAPHKCKNVQTKEKIDLSFSKKVSCLQSLCGAKFKTFPALPAFPGGYLLD